MGGRSSPTETPLDSERLAVTSFLFWGLFTLWAYSAYTFLRAIGRHLASCRQKAFAPYAALEPGTEAARAFEALERSGFRLDARLAPTLVASLAAAMVLIVFWFIAIVVLGLAFPPAVVVGLVAASSFLFVAGITALLLVAARTMKAHELAWRILSRHRGNPAGLRLESAPADLVQRWEAEGNRLMLFG